MDAEAQSRQIERQHRRKWVVEIDKEYASLKAQEAATGQHNADLQKSILKSWKQESPKMWANLKKDGPHFADKLAYVLQERMWKQYDVLVKSGMNMTDARRMAEEDNLMLDPESDLSEAEKDSQEKYGRLSEYTPPLPKSARTT